MKKNDLNEPVRIAQIMGKWVGGGVEAVIPKFAGVGTGIDWFKERGQWEAKASERAQSGWLIFFDWEQDGKPNNVGIVDHVENGMIYTVEGNSTDDGVRQKIYFMNSPVIYGFGVPNYT